MIITIVPGKTSDKGLMKSTCTSEIISYSDVFALHTVPRCKLLVQDELPPATATGNTVPASTKAANLFYLVTVGSFNLYLRCLHPSP